MFVVVVFFYNKYLLFLKKIRMFIFIRQYLITKSEQHLWQLKYWSEHVT